MSVGLHPGSADYVQFVHISHLNKFLSVAEHPLLIVMKPFSELFSVDRETLKKTTAVFYGSFNFSSTCALLSVSEVESFINESFQQAIVFESFFAMGADNNLSPKNAPELYNLFKTADCFRGYFQWLEHSIQVWNAHIAARQLKNLAATIGALQSSWDNESLRSNLVEKLNRSQKIVTNIANDSLQMVFADTGLMSCILAHGRALRTKILFSRRCHSSQCPYP